MQNFSKHKALSSSHCLFPQFRSNAPYCYALHTGKAHAP